MTLDEAYAAVCADPYPRNDIHPNISALEQHVKDTEAKTIIELGVRTGNSTIVFLHALGDDGTLWSVDVNWPKGDYMAALNQPNWVFARGNDLDSGLQLPQDADLLFIDTCHQYEHTRNELAMHMGRVRDGGRILLHDTDLEYPETAPGEEPYPVRRAAEEFADDHELEFVNDATGYGLGCIYV